MCATAVSAPCSSVDRLFAGCPPFCLLPQNHPDIYMLAGCLCVNAGLVAADSNVLAQLRAAWYRGLSRWSARRTPTSYDFMMHTLLQVHIRTNSTRRTRGSIGQESVAAITKVLRVATGPLCLLILTLGAQGLAKLQRLVGSAAGSHHDCGQ